MYNLFEKKKHKSGTCLIKWPSALGLGVIVLKRRDIDDVEY